MDPQLPDLVGQLLERWEVPPRFLTLELTESFVMADSGRSLGVLAGLSEVGVLLSIDDFGTGYSSLSYLKRLPIGEIKIDRSFVMNMHENANDAMIVRATTDLGRNLGLRVVAEGVETREAWDQLAALHCDIAQGYYLSRPIPAHEITRWLALRELDRAGTPERAPATDGPRRAPRPWRPASGLRGRSRPGSPARPRSHAARRRRARRRPRPRSSGRARGSRLPAIAAVTPGCATFQASASCASVIPSRSATGRSRSTAASEPSRSAR